MKKLGAREIQRQVAWEITVWQSAMYKLWIKCRETVLELGFHTIYNSQSLFLQDSVNCYKLQSILEYFDHHNIYLFVGVATPKRIKCFNQLWKLI